MYSIPPRDVNCFMQLHFSCASLNSDGAHLKSLSIELSEQVWHVMRRPYDCNVLRMYEQQLLSRPHFWQTSKSSNVGRDQYSKGVVEFNRGRIAGIFRARWSIQAFCTRWCSFIRTKATFELERLDQRSKQWIFFPFFNLNITCFNVFWNRCWWTTTVRVSVFQVLAAS